MRGGPGILIATLGSKPHAVTTAVDLLSGEGYALSEAVLAHMVQPHGDVDLSSEASSHSSQSESAQV